MLVVIILELCREYYDSILKKYNYVKIGKLKFEKINKFRMFDVSDLMDGGHECPPSLIHTHVTVLQVVVSQWVTDDDKKTKN